MCQAVSRAARPPCELTRVSTSFTNAVGDNLDAVRPGTMSFTLLRQTRCGRRWDAADEAGVESDPYAQDWLRCWQ